MLLKLYVISTLLCFLTAYISAKAIDAKLERERRKRKEAKLSIYEKIHSCFPMLIPLFNIFIMLVFIFKFDDLLEKAMKESITKPISEP